MFTAARGRIQVGKGWRGIWCNLSRLGPQRSPASEVWEKRVLPAAQPGERMGDAQAEEALPWAGGRRPPAAARAARRAAPGAAARSTLSWPLSLAPPSARSPGSGPALDCRLQVPGADLKPVGEGPGRGLRLGTSPLPTPPGGKGWCLLPGDWVKAARES